MVHSMSSKLDTLADDPFYVKQTLHSQSGAAISLVSSLPSSIAGVKGSPKYSSADSVADAGTAFFG